MKKEKGIDVPVSQEAINKVIESESKVRL